MKNINNLLQEEAFMALFAAAGREPVGVREIAALADKLGYDRSEARSMLQEAVARGLLDESVTGFAWNGYRQATPAPDTKDGRVLAYTQVHPWEDDRTAIQEVLGDELAKNRLSNMTKNGKVCRIKMEGDRNWRYAVSIPEHWMELPKVDRTASKRTAPEATTTLSVPAETATQTKPTKKPDVRRVERETKPPRSIDAPKELENEPWWSDLLAKKNTHSLKDLATEFGTSVGQLSAALKRTGTVRSPTPVNPKGPLEVGSSVTFRNREVTKEVVREIPKVEIREVRVEVPVTKEVIKEVEVIRTVTNTIHSGLTLTPEMNALIAAVPEAEKAILDSVHDTELLISAARKRDQLLQSLGRMLIQLSLSAQINTATATTTEKATPKPAVEEQVKVRLEPIEEVPEAPKATIIKVVEPKVITPLPAEALVSTPKVPEVQGQKVMDALVRVQGIRNVRGMIEDFTLGATSESIATKLGVRRENVLKWKKDLGGGTPYRLHKGIVLPEDDRPLRQYQQNTEEVFDPAIEQRILAGIPPYLPFHKADEAVDLFDRADIYLRQKLPSWHLLPADKQRALLGYITCLIRHGQEILGGRENLTAAQSGVFQRLTRWSAEIQPGFVYGLSATHEPYSKTWWHDGEPHAAALGLEIRPLAKEVQVPESGKGFTMGDLVTSINEGIDDTLLEAMVDYLLDHEGINQKHLVQVLVPVREQLPKKPAFKRLLTQVYKKYEELNPDAEEVEDETFILPPDWIGFSVTEGKRILLMGGDERQEALARLKAELKTDLITWNSGWSAAGVDPEVKRIKNGGYDLIIVLRGYNNHSTADKTVRAAKESGVMFVTPRSYGLQAVRRAIETLPACKPE